MTDRFLAGLRVASDLPLPELVPWTGDDRPCDLEIRLGTVPERLEAPVFEGPVLQVGADGTCRFAIEAVATYLVEGGCRITVQPRLAADVPDIRVFLLGSVFGFLCHQRGLLPLHAGCLGIDGSAVAIAGEAGAGKSTLTAAFLRRGFRVLADDVTVVDTAAPSGPVVLPSFPRIKLWRDAIDGLGYPTAWMERTRADLEKFQLPTGAAFDVAPSPLAAVIHLNIVTDERHEALEGLRGFGAMDALTGNIYRRMAAVRMGRKSALLASLMPLVKLTNLRLSRKRDLSRLDDTVDLLTERIRAGY